MRGYEGHRVHRSLFISDLHLGSRFCDVRSLTDFLLHNDAETIFLVGDIVDLWSLGRRVRWHAGHGQVLHLLCRKMQSGTRLVLLPGNHDDNLRTYLGLALGAIEVCHDYVHETAAGARYLVVHGDKHDRLVCRADRLSRAACRWKERLVPDLKPRHASVEPGADAKGLFSGFMWRHASATRRIEEGIASEAASRGLDGVISGHTHAPADREVSGVRYLNCGDWIGNSTAISESFGGELDLFRWQLAARGAEAQVPGRMAPAGGLARAS